MEILHLIINIIVGTFIIVSLFAIYSIIMEYLSDWLEVKHIDKTHRDNRPGSFYYESNKKD